MIHAIITNNDNDNNSSNNDNRINNDYDNEVLGTMKITSLYQVSQYIRVNPKQRNTKSWDHSKITLL